MKRILFIITPLIVLFSACGVSNVDDPTPSKTPPATSTIIPSQTRTPTITNYPTSPPSPTSNPFTILPAPNEWPYPNPISNRFPMSFEGVSPNRNWVYFWVNSIYIAHISGPVIWELPISLAQELSGGCCTYYTNLKWSQDGRYLYFSTLPYIDPACPFCDGLGYWQLDIITGEISEILPVSETASFQPVYAMSLSNNDKSLAYISIWEKPVNLLVLNIETREELTFPIDEKYEVTGNIIWGPHDERLIYIGAANGDPSTYRDENNYSIILLDISSGIQQILLETDNTDYLPTNWEDTNLIEFDLGCENLYFDIISKSFTVRATQTPDPDPRFEEWCESGLYLCCP